MMLRKVTEIDIEIFLLLGLFAVRFLMWRWVVDLAKIVGEKTQGSWFSTAYNMTWQSTSLFGACTVIDEHAWLSAPQFCGTTLCCVPSQVGLCKKLQLIGYQ